MSRVFKNPSYLPVSNGLHQYETADASHRRGWLWLTILYGLAVIGGVYVVAYWLAPVIRFLLPR